MMLRVPVMTPTINAEYSGDCSLETSLPRNRNASPSFPIRNTLYTNEHMLLKRADPRQTIILIPIAYIAPFPQYDLKRLGRNGSTGVHGKGATKRQNIPTTR
jgi:hypothetical protein